jgi:hypothetical protein
MLDILLRQGFDINSRGLSRHTPLIHSACVMNTVLAKSLINANSDINLVSEYGNTALLLSIVYRAYDIAEMLLDAKADVTIKNKNGRDALGMLAEYIQVKDDMPRWQITRNRIEKLLAPQSIESKEIEVYVESKTEPEVETYINENGDILKIPKIEIIVIQSYWNKDSAPERVEFKVHSIKGNRIVNARRLENGKWIDCEITFPREYNYDIKVPRNVKPKFHIIGPSDGFPSIRENMIVQFDDFEYA